MAGKNSRVVKNIKQSKQQKEENTINLNLGFRFENEYTITESGLMDASVLQGVLLVLSNRNSTFIQNIVDTQLDFFKKSGFFDNTTVRNLIQQGDIPKATKKFRDIVKQKCPNTMYLTFCLYHKVLSVLYEYFDFHTYVSTQTGKAYLLCQYLLLDCYMKTMHNAFLLHIKGLPKEKVTDILCQCDSKEDEENRSLAETSSLLPTYIHFDCDESIKEDFCKIVNAVRVPWHSNDEDVRNTRNTFEILDGLELSNDWSGLIQILHKDFYKIPKGTIHFGVGDLFKVDYTKKSDLKVITDSDIKDSIAALIAITDNWYEPFNLHIISSCFDDYAKVVLSEKFRMMDQEKSELNLQIKDLKNTNRSLTRDMTKLGAEIETLKQEQNKNKELLEQAKQSEEESQELIDLREQIEQLKSDNSELSVSLTKSENKNSWSDNKIKELEGELKYYDGVEQSLMTLQNENNVLLADIERIEGLELEVEEDTSDFERKFEAIKNEHIMFIGGTGDMLQRYVDMFPNADNINISDNNPNFTIPARFKYVAIYTKVVKHSFCARAESLVGKECIINLNILNKNLVIDELYKSIVGHKNKN